MWPFKNHASVVPDDVDESRRQRACTEEQLRTVNARAPRVAAMTAYLAERREQNHFGESIQITFVPRRADG
jgi:hypothetical protein